MKGYWDSDVRRLWSALGGGEGCTLVDVREYPEYAAGHVPGAHLIPLGELGKRAGELERDRTIYLVCRTGRRSGEAQRKLLELGFTDVRNVRGGMVEWEAAGFAVERDERAPWSLERQVRFAAGLLVVAGVLLSIYVSSAFVLLAGFVGAGLVYASVTDTCAMGMLIARLPWNRARAGGGEDCCEDGRQAEEG